MKSVLQEKPEVLAIIPARGGSKGLPQKNIRDLCGKPLIAYSIEVALKSKLIDRVVVSTEDEEIAEISKSFGAEIPFLRPMEMARDNSSIAEAINYTIQRLRKDGYFPDILAYMYPTHPFRTVKLIDFLVKKAIDGYAPVQTVKKISYPEVGPFVRNKDGKMVPIFHHGRKNETQHRKTFFHPYGTFHVTTSSGVGRGYLHTLNDPVSLIDIDTFSDLKVAREVIRSGFFDFFEE